MKSFYQIMRSNMTDNKQPLNTAQPLTPKGEQIQPLNPLKGTLPPDLLKEENLKFTLQGAGGLDWVETTLGEVVKTNISSIGKDFEFDEILYLDTGSITENKIEQLQSFSTSEAPSRTKRLVKENDILYSTVRPNQRHFGFIQNPQENLVVSTGFTVISAISEKANSKFLYYFFTQDQITNKLQQIAEHSTSTYPSIRPEHIENLEISIPPLPEQVAIASVLSAFDDKIELLREQNKILEEMGQVIFREQIQPPSPLKGGQEVFQSPKGGEKKSPLGDLGALPEGWRVGKFGEVCEITSGKRPENISETKTEQSQIPLLGATKIMGFVENYLFDGKTLVIGRVGTHGEVQRFNEKIFPSDNTLVIKSSDFIFVYQILKSIDYVKMNRGAVQPLITQTDLKNYEIIIPSDEVLQNFKEVTNPVFEKIDQNDSQIQSLSRSRDELLPRLMSGEVRVEF